MTETVTIGAATLIFGDCLEILPTLDHVDHVISDPPYEKEAHKKMRRTKRNLQKGENADLDFAMITDSMRDDVARHGVRLSDGWLLLFCQAEAVGLWRDAIEAANGRYKRSMIWVKPDSSPQFNGQMPAMGYESMTLAWCGNGYSSWNGGGGRGVFTHPVNVGRDGRHPTEKPLPLMLQLIELFTDPGQLVLDPFMGSGTTGLACLMRGRRFIGIEQKRDYFDVACERLDKAMAQGDMFRAAMPKPRQVALDLAGGVSRDGR